MRLEERYETTDGSRPDAVTLDDELARRLPLTAFTHLQAGDAFEDLAGAPPASGAAKAAAYFEAKVRLLAHAAPPAQLERVRSDVVRQLSCNPVLVARLMGARPIAVDLVPKGKRLTAFGYPASVSERASGLFWDHPSWPNARMALRQDRLDGEPILVIHEMAHAIHYLAFTQAERERIYRILLPTYGSRAAADEVFAIYSEKEFLDEFSPDHLRAPGVYGMARERWDEDHVFTRFVRNLYFPHKPFAGPKPMLW